MSVNDYIHYLAAFSKHASRFDENSRLQQYLQTDSFINLHNTQRYFNASVKNNEWNQNIVYSLSSSGSSGVSRKISYFLRHNQFSDLTTQELSVIFSESVHPFPPSHTVYKHSKHDTEENPEEYNYIYYLSPSKLGNASVIKSSIKVAPAVSKRQHNSRRQLRDDSSNFEDSLNWASTNNPKNRAITSYVRNQGLCGGCWAFVSAGCVEASIAKNIDRSVLLSVQELIDCDVEYDKGCSGGNPINAFRYIMVRGLTTSDRYPLSTQSQKQGSCRDSSEDPVRGSIKGFMTVSPYRQDLMAQSLLSQGPLSVGVCGTDPDFLYYGGGIFNPDTCCSTLNHAILLVGYGTDADSKQDYWIAQNSWGSLWGESGFMRILKTIDVGAGVCGLALTPSVALGGYLAKGVNHSDGADDFNSRGEGSETSRKIKEIAVAIQQYVALNWRTLVTASAAFCFTASLLTLMYMCICDCCHAMRRRRVTRPLHSPMTGSPYRPYRISTSHHSTPTKVQPIPVYADSYQHNYHTQPTAPLLPVSEHGQYTAKR